MKVAVEAIIESYYSLLFAKSDYGGIKNGRATSLLYR